MLEIHDGITFGFYLGAANYYYTKSLLSAVYVLVLDVRVSEQRTPASSKWEQSVVTES